MKRICCGFVLCLGLAIGGLAVGGMTTETMVKEAPQISVGSFRDAEAALTPAERAGREIWFNATAGNARFFTYVFPQRIGVAIDWFRILGANGREDRFKLWGLMNDPDCCKPGDPHCPARSADETFGLDWCPGDDRLLPFVGKAGFRDPACDFKDAPLAVGEVHA
jgi:hypothetical protein